MQEEPVISAVDAALPWALQPPFALWEYGIHVLLKEICVNKIEEDGRVPLSFKRTLRSVPLAVLPLRQRPSEPAWRAGSLTCFRVAAVCSQTQ